MQTVNYYKRFRYWLSEHKSYLLQSYHPRLLDWEIARFLKSRKQGTSGNKEKKIVVSLTSYPKRIANPLLLPKVLFALMMQSRKPDVICLVLSKEEFPCGEEGLPQYILDFIPHGLTILWSEGNIRSYKKLFPAQTEYPNAVIITADDDIWYPRYWLKKLLAEHKRYPNDIICHGCWFIPVKGSKIPLYNQWLPLPPLKRSDCRILPLGACGAVYPPRVFTYNGFDEETIIQLAPQQDDLGFWAMGILSHRTTTLVKRGNRYPIELLENDPDALCKFNRPDEGPGGNDLALERIFARYPEILNKILLDEGKN